LTKFVKNLVAQTNYVKTQAVIIIKNYFYDFCAEDYIKKNYVKNREIYPEYMEAFFNLLDYYTRSYFDWQSIKSVPYKQFLN